MEVWIALFLLTSCQAAVILTPRNPDDTGAAVTFQNQDVLGQYDFGYSEGHPSGASFRRESGDALGNKVGSFGLRDADGRMRVVRYVADANGFRAEVTSNEPGVAPQDPASATINKPAILPVPAAPVVPVAPVAVPPPPPPPPAPVAIPQRVYGPPPVAYNYLPAGPVAVPPPPPPPPSYFPPRAVAPYAAPVAPVGAPYPPPFGPVAVAPVAKSVAAYPPPPAYYTNLVQGKEYITPLRNYASLFPPFAAVPPQFNYLNIKNPPVYPAVGVPL